MSNNTEFQLLSLSDVRTQFRVSKDALSAWERQGLLKAYRTPGGDRRWKREDLFRLFGIDQEDANGSSVQ